jgi:uncharacterized MAPEG superfamily protein
MPTESSPELTWLIATAAMTGLFWVPYILNRLNEQGILAGLWDPQGLTDTKVGWARRMMQAHDNAVENLVVFAPLALAVHLLGTGTELTAGAAMTYWFARLGHYLVFSLGVPVLRIVCFLVGFACQVILALNLLGWI